MTKVPIFSLVLPSNWKKFARAASAQVQSSLFSWSHITQSPQAIGPVQMLCRSCVVPARAIKTFFQLDRSTRLKMGTLVVRKSFFIFISLVKLMHSHRKYAWINDGHFHWNNKTMLTFECTVVSLSVKHDYEIGFQWTICSASRARTLLFHSPPNGRLETTCLIEHKDFDVKR